MREREQIQNQVAQLFEDYRSREAKWRARYKMGSQKEIREQVIGFLTDLEFKKNRFAMKQINRNLEDNPKNWRQAICKMIYKLRMKNKMAA